MPITQYKDGALHFFLSRGLVGNVCKVPNTHIKNHTLCLVFLLSCNRYSTEYKIVS